MSVDEGRDDQEQGVDAGEGGRVTVSAARRTPRGTLSRHVLLDSARVGRSASADKEGRFTFRVVPPSAGNKTSALTPAMTAA